jgi:hypothetical protein
VWRAKFIKLEPIEFGLYSILHVRKKYLVTIIAPRKYSESNGRLIVVDQGQKVMWHQGSGDAADHTKLFDKLLGRCWGGVVINQPH